MGRFWDKFFKKPENPTENNLENILSGIIPLYTSEFGENIYASDVVQQAIYSIVTELKKLDPVHIRKIGNDLISVDGDVQNVLDAPNPLMTTSDFIEKTAWILLLNYNAFIYPIRENGKLKALYPLQPLTVAFDTNYAGTGEIWVRFTFPNGYTGDVPYKNLIHLRHHFSMSEFMGGNINGQPDFKPVLDTLKLNDALLKGLAKSLNLQTSINGIVKLKSMQNYADQLEKVREFEKKLQSNESGMLPMDVSAEYIPITKQVNLLDEKVLAFIDKKILRTWGVSIAIVNGDYTKEQYEAFYQKTLEPIVKSWGQAFTKGIFTDHAVHGFNNCINFYVKELIFMNTSQKLELFSRLGERGSCYENEYRTVFGLRPMPELEGVRMVSLNYINSKYAQEYQTGKTSNEGSEE